MKLIIRGLFCASFITMPAFASEPATDLEKLSYSLGIMLGQRINNDFGALDPAFVLDGLEDSGDPKSWKMDQSSITRVVQEANELARKKKQQQTEEQQRQMEAMGQANLKSGEEYLAQNAKKEGVKVTASGLQYRVLKVGSGKAPTITDTVRVDYEGKLISGDIFDSSRARGEPVSFPLNGVIPGWSEGVQLMRPGALFEFTIPAALAYGPSGTGPIPPNSVLVFEVELLEVNPAN